LSFGSDTFSSYILKIKNFGQVAFVRFDFTFSKQNIERILPMCLIIRRAKPFKKDTFLFSKTRQPKYQTQYIKTQCIKSDYHSTYLQSKLFK